MNDIAIVVSAAERALLLRLRRLFCLRRAWMRRERSWRGGIGGKCSCVAGRLDALCVQSMNVLWVGMCIVQLGSGSALPSFVIVVVLLLIKAVVVLLLLMVVEVLVLVLVVDVVVLEIVAIVVVVLRAMLVVVVLWRL